VKRKADTPGENSTERMCIVTREVLDCDDLLRFAVSPDGVLTPDLRRKLPGRGIHVRSSAAALKEAMRRKAFERGLKRAVTVPDSLAEDVARLMRQDLVQALALANKAGQVVTGFGKVETCLAQGAAVAVLEAGDGAEDGKRKLRQAAQRGYGEAAAALPVINCLSSDDFQLAFGRDLVIHAALVPGPAAGACLSRWRRLTRFQTEALPLARAKTLADTTAVPDRDTVPDTMTIVQCAAPYTGAGTLNRRT
jgi:uncharacterized protein